MIVWITRFYLNPTIVIRNIFFMIHKQLIRVGWKITVCPSTKGYFCYDTIMSRLGSTHLNQTTQPVSQIMSSMSSLSSSSSPSSTSWAGRSGSASGVGGRGVLPLDASTIRGWSRWRTCMVEGAWERRKGQGAVGCSTRSISGVTNGMTCCW